jgi:hypothetical protein
MRDISELNVSNSSEESVHIGTPKFKEIKRYFGRLKEELDQKMEDIDTKFLDPPRNSRQSFHRSMEPIDFGDTFLDGDESWDTCRYLQSTVLEPSLFVNETTNLEFQTAFSTQFGETLGSPTEIGISLDTSTIVVSSEDSEEEMKDDGAEKGAGTPVEIPRPPQSPAISGNPTKPPENLTKKPTLKRNHFSTKTPPKSVKRSAPIPFGTHLNIGITKRKRISPTAEYIKGPQASFFTKGHLKEKSGAFAHLSSESDEGETVDSSDPENHKPSLPYRVCLKLADGDKVSFFFLLKNR